MSETTTETTTTTTTVDSKETHVLTTTQLRAQIEERLKFADGVLATTKGANIYNANLPAGVTPDLVKALHKYDVMYTAAGAGAAANVAAATFKENADIAQINAELSMGDGVKMQVMASRKEGLSVAVVNNIVNPHFGTLKKVFTDFDKAMSDMAGE